MIKSDGVHTRIAFALMQIHQNEWINVRHLKPNKKIKLKFYTQHKKKTTMSTNEQ